MNFENTAGSEVILQNVNSSVIVSNMVKWQFQRDYIEFGTLEIPGSNLFLHAGTDMKLTIEEGDFRFN